MATTHKSVTGQGVGSPEPAAGQGGKAGPQASSSCDRSCSLVDDLAFEQSNATSDLHKLRNFCVMCGVYIPQFKKFNFTDELKNKYTKCFNICYDTLNNSWTPKSICNRCRHILCRNTKQIFSSPMIWNNPTNHTTDCYFCLTNVKGINRKNRRSITYASVSSVTPPVFISNESADDNSMDVEEENFHASTNRDSNDSDGEISDASEGEGSEDSSEGKVEEDDIKKIVREFRQTELNDLCRDLGLSKEQSELLASRLKEKNNLASGTKITHYRSRERSFRKFFSRMNNLVYCNNVKGLVNEYNIQYITDDWRLFIDSSTRSLKAILLHNGNIYATLPLAHSIVMNEEYHNFNLLLKKIKYDEHNWQLCGDLKMLIIMLGQQSGFVKYPCFICEWDSRARNEHYVKKVWPLRENLTPGDKNIINEGLIPTNRVILPPLHIKLGLVKQFIKAMARNQSSAFMYIFEIFPRLSEAKINEGIFTGPDIRKLLKNEEFERRMTEKERAAWSSFREVAKKFLGNNKDANYKNIVANLINNYRDLGCLMNLKLHFLDSHLDFFPENLGDFSEEQGERFHQDLKEFEKRYQGVWGVNMLADYCWNLKRETTGSHKRKAIRRTFATKRKRFHAQD